MTEAYISTRCKKILYMIMASDTYVSVTTDFRRIQTIKKKHLL